MAIYPIPQLDVASKCYLVSSKLHGFFVLRCGGFRGLRPQAQAIPPPLVLFPLPVSPPPHSRSATCMTSGLSSPPLARESWGSGPEFTSALGIRGSSPIHPHDQELNWGGCKCLSRRDLPFFVSVCSVASRLVLDIERKHLVILSCLCLLRIAL